MFLLQGYWKIMQKIVKLQSVTEVISQRLAALNMVFLCYGQRDVCLDLNFLKTDYCISTDIR